MLTDVLYSVNGYYYFFVEHFELSHVMDIVV